MNFNNIDQDTFILNTFAIEREARMLRAQAMQRFFASARAWVASKLSGTGVMAGETA